MENTVMMKFIETKTTSFICGKSIGHLVQRHELNEPNFLRIQWRNNCW